MKTKIQNKRTFPRLKKMIQRDLDREIARLRHIFAVREIMDRYDKQSYVVKTEEESNNNTILFEPSAEVATLFQKKVRFGGNVHAQLLKARVRAKTDEEKLAIERIMELRTSNLVPVHQGNRAMKEIIAISLVKHRSAEDRYEHARECLSWLKIATPEYIRFCFAVAMEIQKKLNSTIYA